MPDGKKVIKDLEECLSASCRGFRPRLSCPYNDEEWNIMRDALALLKEQEAVESKPVDLYGKDEWFGLVCVCPDCNAEWMTDKANTHFCPNCGRPVKWDG